MKKNSEPATPGTSLTDASSTENGTSNTAKRRNAKSKAIVPFRLGKDEMNLVEHPFALLKRGGSEEPIHLVWDKIHPRTGKTIHAVWRVFTDPSIGLPGPVEERLYLVMMELSREQGWPETVMFSRADILDRLGVTKNASRYAMVREAFLRLKTVTIEARHSFWHAETQDFASSVMFNMVDEVFLVDEEPGRREGQQPLALSSFRWSAILHRSLIAGNIRSLSIEFALSLELPLSARLFRYLDKHRTGDKDANRNKFEIELHRLCEIHLGMARARYASKLKERLLPALEELKVRGFLAGWNYEPMKSAPGEEKAVFFFSNGPLDPSADAVTASEAVLTAPSAQNGEAVVPLGFSAVDLIVAWDIEDEETREAACDAVFEDLTGAEKAVIEEWALAQIPSFLRNNRSTEGARSTIRRYVRSRVMDDFGDRVRAILSEAARAEVTSPRLGAATDD